MKLNEKYVYWHPSDLKMTRIYQADKVDTEIEQLKKEKEMLMGWIIDKTKKGKDFKRDDAIRAIERALLRNK